MADINQVRGRVCQFGDAEAKSMADQMLDCESRLTEEKEVLQEVQPGASSPYSDKVLSTGSSHRSHDGYANRSFASYLRKHKTAHRPLCYQNRCSNEARCA
jgi:hypothetical protein